MLDSVTVAKGVTDTCGRVARSLGCGECVWVGVWVGGSVCGWECVWVGVCVGGCVGGRVCGWECVCVCVCVGEQTKVPYSITKVNMFSFNNTVISMATSLDNVNNIYLCYILNGHIPSSHVTCSQLHSNPPLHSG